MLAASSLTTFRGRSRLLLYVDENYYYFIVIKAQTLSGLKPRFLDQNMKRCLGLNLQPFCIRITWHLEPTHYSGEVMEVGRLGVLSTLGFLLL